MQDKSNISIFQGSTVEADTVHDFLAQQGIGSLVRNHMQETLDAGWVTADAEHAAEVFVALEDEKRAVDLLRNLFSEDTALPVPGTHAATTGNAVIITEPSTEEFSAEGDSNTAAWPVNLPKIIAVPTADNRPPLNSPAATNPAERSAATNAEIPPRHQG